MMLQRPLVPCLLRRKTVRVVRYPLVSSVFVGFSSLMYASISMTHSGCTDKTIAMYVAKHETMSRKN